MLKLDQLKSLYGTEPSPEFDRIFKESRVALALRHRRMAEDKPHLIRQWQDGRFVTVEA